ncbi:hypothetical protein FHS26_000908 [Rhizobium pisi]|uniref:Uncharacterized protein n=1 Tax=Rhizobium pisi TaxID=574561 RepID=A0A7W5FY14_9HYPH|nr:hypothetical protein [Rhizobium pisi]
MRPVTGGALVHLHDGRLRRLARPLDSNATIDMRLELG